MAQLVEHILGKDEVPGSNPGISLRSTPVVRKYDRGISFLVHLQPEYAAAYRQFILNAEF